jgi:magnesium-transporting ATPase (P-type)
MSIEQANTSDVPTESLRRDAVPATGLTEAEAQARLHRDGANEVPERRVHPLARFVRKFWGLSAWMLELIAVLSLILHRTADFWIALSLIVVNAVVSFLQEESLEAVASSRQLQVTARVRRDGMESPCGARTGRGDMVRIRLEISSRPARDHRRR